MLVLNARMKVLEETRKNGSFALVTEKTRDISKKRIYCTKDYTIKEYFIGRREGEKGIGIRVRCRLTPKYLTGYSFDGASAMNKLGRLMNDIQMINLFTFIV